MSPRVAEQKPLSDRGPVRSGGSAERPMERGGNCVERNGSERAKDRERSGGESPASTRPRERKRHRAPGIGGRAAEIDLLRQIH